MHSELDFRPVQIITGHVIYNSPYKYWPDENGHSGVQRKNSRSLELKAADIAWRVKATRQIRDDWENGDTIPLVMGH